MIIVTTRTAINNNNQKIIIPWIISIIMTTLVTIVAIFFLMDLYVLNIQDRPDHHYNHNHDQQFVSTSSTLHQHHLPTQSEDNNNFGYYDKINGTLV